MTEEERLREFLVAIVAHGGRVCGEFETCKHQACASNYETWSYANAALEGRTLEQVRAENNRLALDLIEVRNRRQISTGFQCFKCGARGAVRIPPPGVHLACPKCKTFDVVHMDLPRTDNGNINNCALVYGDSPANCQMCCNDCPEAIKFNHVFRSST